MLQELDYDCYCEEERALDVAMDPAVGISAVGYLLYHSLDNSVGRLDFMAAKWTNYSCLNILQTG